MLSKPMSFMLLVFGALIIFAGSSMQASAQECLTLHLKSGARVLFPLSENPNIDITPYYVSIGEKHYPMSEVSKYDFTKSQTGIVKLDDGHTLHYCFTGSGYLQVTGLRGKTPLRLYDSNGRWVQLKHIPAEEGIILDCSACPRGVYILKCGDKTLKITR